MKLSVRFPRKKLIILCMLSVSLSAFCIYGISADDEDYPMVNVRVPVQRYSDNKLKVELHAKRAKVIEIPGLKENETRMLLKGVEIKHFKQNGDQDGRVLADDCTYIQKSQFAFSKKKIKIERQGATISGVGYEWNSKEQLFEITDDAKVSFERKLKKTDKKLVTSVATSDYLSFDYSSNIAFFKDNVKIVDPLVTMTSDKLTVLFEGTNELKSATAQGNVVFTAEKGSGKCEKAVYITAVSKVIMTGDPDFKTEEGDRLIGKKITAWVDENRVTAEPASLVIPEREKKEKKDQHGKKDVEEEDLDLEPGVAPSGDM